MRTGPRAAPRRTGELVLGLLWVCAWGQPLPSQGLETQGGDRDGDGDGDRAGRGCWRVPSPGISGDRGGPRRAQRGLWRRRCRGMPFRAAQGRWSCVLLGTGQLVPRLRGRGWAGWVRSSVTAATSAPLGLLSWDHDAITFEDGASFPSEVAAGLLARLRILFGSPCFSVFVSVGRR